MSTDVSEDVETAASARDNINKVIAEMSPCPQVLWIRWMLKTGASGRRYRNITWTVGVVEFGDSGRCVRPQNRAWASSQWEADNITNEILFCFLFEKSIRYIYFSLVLCTTIHYEAQLVLRIYQVETHSPWLTQGYATSIFELGVGFRAPANFSFLVDVTIYSVI